MSTLIVVRGTSDRPFAPSSPEAKSKMNPKVRREQKSQLRPSQLIMYAHSHTQLIISEGDVEFSMDTLRNSLIIYEENIK